MMVEESGELFSIDSIFDSNSAVVVSKLQLRVPSYDCLTVIWRRSVLLLHVPLQKLQLPQPHCSEGESTCILCSFT